MSLIPLPAGILTPRGISIARAVTASGDDAVEIISTGVTDITIDIVNLAGDRISGIRFQNITIPQGATILSAIVTGASVHTSAGTSTIRTWCEDADNAAAFTATATNVSGRTKTTALVDWGFAVTTSGPSQASSNLATCVQEVVDRALWVSGNALVFLFQHQTGEVKRWASFDHTTALEPQLAITYAP